ncbi:MAG: tetratricopeptide repeat protein [Steroidobacteraceae bacterium]
MTESVAAEIDPEQAERWQHLQRVFAEATDLPKDQQERFVKETCGGDEGLIGEVLAMLQCDAEPSNGPLTNALDAAIDATTTDRRQALIGTVVGSYRLVSVLGHGGAGSVYLAERSDRQYSAQVAVKIVESAALHPDMSMRFRAERQILASLNHPNIARLVDAGETEKGLPYLVMEYVHGSPVDRYCDQRQLDMDDRLELFLQICTAVQYAHQNLVVHRDLKPANILVTEDGVPKLLDFGIAKLLDASPVVTQSLALTRMNDRLLTPEYASPEQILGRPVTTSSDVYALGVVLYELLTGRRPYTVTATSQLELERSICVTDPPRPSTVVRRPVDVLDSKGTTATSLAASRRVSPERLEKRLVGDLDAIVMRALRKEAVHRYGSVEQLAADLRRHLASEPVVARQGNWAYYSQRFVRRHAFGVAASITGITLLTAFAVMTSIQATRIANERDRATQEGQRAEQVSNFMLDVFAAADPFVNQGKEVTARELLDQASRRISGDLNQQPDVRARLLEAIGRAYRRQGQFDRAVVYLEDSVRLRRENTSPGTSGLAGTLTELALTLRELGRFDESERSFNEAVSILSSQGQERTAAKADLLVGLGQMELQRGNLDRAQDFLEQSAKLNSELFGPEHPEVATVLSDLMSVSLWKNDLEGAEKLAREAERIYRISLPELHPDRVMSQYLLGDILSRRGRTDEAGKLLEQALGAQRILYGDASPRTAATMDALALTRQAQNRLDDAEKLAREALVAGGKAHGNRHFMTGYYHTSLAGVLIKKRKFAEAEKEARTALDIYNTSLPADHQYVASAEHQLGEIMLETGRPADAEALLTAAVNRWQRTGAPQARIARSASALGEALYRLNRPKEAEKYLSESYQQLVDSQGAKDDATIVARRRLEKFYGARGEKEKLDALSASTGNAQNRR